MVMFVASPGSRDAHVVIQPTDPVLHLGLQTPRAELVAVLRERSTQSAEDGCHAGVAAAAQQGYEEGMFSF